MSASSSVVPARYSLTRTGEWATASSRPSREKAITPGRSPAFARGMTHARRQVPVSSPTYSAPVPATSHRPSGLNWTRQALVIGNGRLYSGRPVRPSHTRISSPCQHPTATHRPSGLTWGSPQINPAPGA